jgi:hypothetical protein
MLIFVSDGKRRHDGSAEAPSPRKSANARINALSNATPRRIAATRRIGMRIGMSNAYLWMERSKRSRRRQPLAASRRTETRPTDLAGGRTLEWTLTRPPGGRDASTPRWRSGGRPLQTSPLDFPVTPKLVRRARTPLPTDDRRPSGRIRPSRVRRRCARTFFTTVW